MQEEIHQFVIEPSQAGDRLDRILAVLIRSEGVEVSRSTLQTWIRDGHVLVNGKSVKPKFVVSLDDQIRVSVPEEKPVELHGEEMDLEVLHEDEDLIVVNKPAGLVVHPASGNLEGTLVNALLHHTDGQLSRLADEDRPGIVHRLDKDTSGCLVAAKSDRAYKTLVEQFSGRETEKEYLAVTEGVPASEEGTLRGRIGRHPGNRQKMSLVESPAGKEAITDYRILKSDPAGEWALLSCVIHTGRTHQIRVHMKEALHCPILGDVIYAQPRRQKVKTDRLMLHAWRLAFRHPDGERISVESAIPEPFDLFR
ncbi:MAG: RluA family pseudouridine synthase [Verrucomicrobiota bacterium]